MTHLNSCRNERGQTYSNKGFSSPSLVNDRANLQRIPLRDNNQILYDNRTPFEIFSLVPYEPSKDPRNSTSVHKLHLSASLVQYIENVIRKSTISSVGFGKRGRCTQLHLELRSGSVLVPWVPGQSRQCLRATSLFRTQEDHPQDRFLAVDPQRVHLYGSTNLTHSFISKWRRFPLPFPTVF